MTYEQTLEFLYNQLPAYHRIGKAAYKNNLDNTIALDKYFGHPHKKYQTIHIAGTNGKGSVSHLTASLLQDKGLRTGLYTSPHLKDFRERIRINGAMIPQEEVIKFVDMHQEIIAMIKPSFFELCVAMAFEFFRKSEIDVAVIETGLGGRLDSTNIISPVLSVITNIGHDHFDLLGDTIEKVAEEKAGIIKKWTPVVIGETSPGTKNVFLQKAGALEAPIFYADSKFKCNIEEGTNLGEKQKYQIRDMTGNELVSGKTPLSGDYQNKNLATLYQVYDNLRDRFGLSKDNFLRGVENVISATGLQGRWQVIDKKPLTICDTGHNREGLEYVTGQIRKLSFRKLHMIIGFVSDKDIESLLPLFPKDAQYYFTRASVQRALDENILKDKALKFGLNGNSFPSVCSALENARINAAADDLIFIGGSTFVVAEVI